MGECNHDGRTWNGDCDECAEASGYARGVEHCVRLVDERAGATAFADKMAVLLEIVRQLRALLPQPSAPVGGGEWMRTPEEDAASDTPMAPAPAGGGRVEVAGHGHERAYGLPDCVCTADTGFRDDCPRTAPPRPPAPQEAEMEQDDLCDKRGGNGVLTIRHGVETCPVCNGRCWKARP